MIKKAIFAALAGLLLTFSASFAQAGGGNETPDAAKEKGTASGGTEGKSNGTTSGAASRGAGTGENKPTATGGQSGGSTNQQ